MNKAEVAKQKYINVLVGSLDAQNQTFLVDCHPLDSGSNVRFLIAVNNCAMRVRAHFKNIDEIIATIKAATIKNKDRKKDFHNAGLLFPIDPVITRWVTLLRAALCYNMNSLAVHIIVNNWTSAGLLVSKANDAINMENLVPDLVKINQF